MPLIKCPRCGCAGGNEVDAERGLTLRCQYCLYTGNAVQDGRQLMTAAQFTTDRDLGDEA